jgi:hypothetical protein
MTEEDVTQFQQRARAYLRTTGRWNPDVLSEMVLLKLEYGAEKMLDMDLLYLQARDRLDPWVQQQGVRQRRSSRTVAFSDPWEPGGAALLPDPLLQKTIATFPPRPRTIFSRLLEGWTQRDIAQDLGVVESAVSLVVRRWLPHLCLKETLPTTDTYTFVCATCGQEKTVHVSGLVAELPLYCSKQCQRGHNNTDHRALRGATWRKYTFTDAMNATIIQAVRRGRFGALKQLWQDDPRFRASGIPYPILKRQARELGLVRTLPSMTWHPDELALVESLLRAGYSTEVILRKLKAQGFHRSAGAVRDVAWKQRWGTIRPYYTMLDVMVGLGTDHKTLRRWVTKGWLTVQPHPQPKTTWRISWHALRQFVRTYPDEVAKGAPDLRWLVRLLTSVRAAPVEEAP